jgi:hypothetical protein
VGILANEQKENREQNTGEPKAKKIDQESDGRPEVMMRCSVRKKVFGAEEATAHHQPEISRRLGS